MTSSAAAPFLHQLPETVPVRDSAAKRWRRWALIFGAWTAYGLSQGVLYKVTLGEGTRWSWAVTICVGVAWFWALLTPGIGWIQRRIEEANLGRLGAFAAHAVIAPAVALIVTVARQRLTTALSPLDIGPMLPNYVYWLDVHILTYAMVVAAAWAFGLHLRYRDRTVRTHMLEVQLARAQLQFLGLQLQPHFLFNTLGAIVVLIQQRKTAQAEAMVEKLSDLLRLTLEDVEAQEVPLWRELEFLRLYLSIEQVRFEDRLKVRIVPAAALSDILVPHMVLQPIVENAVRHGLGQSEEAVTIEVSASSANGSLMLVVSDDGPGILSESHGHSGIGLTNTGNRLARLYGDKATLVVGPAATRGVRVTITLPIRMVPPEAEPCN